jgi:hypothetical protein
VLLNIPDEYTVPVLLVCALPMIMRKFNINISEENKRE